MLRLWTAAILAAAILAGTAATRPAAAQAAGEEEFDVAAALKKVAELMRETEARLVEALSTDKAEAAAESGEKAREEIEKLLRQGERTGQEAADKMTEILEKAPRASGQGGGGEDQAEQRPDSEEERRRREQEQKAQDRDPKNSAQGNKEPKDGQEQKDEPSGETAKPPPSETDDPSMPDPNEDWLGRLPDKLRQAVLNREFDKIPPKFRKLMEAYFKRMAEVESDR